MDFGGAFDAGLAFASACSLIGDLSSKYPVFIVKQDDVVGVRGGRQRRVEVHNKLMQVSRRNGFFL